MLVEDDFPFCMGEHGWDVVTRVMTILEDSRSEATHVPKKPGGFVGTGGRYVCRPNTCDLHSKLSPNVARRPADLIIQDCLLGNDPLCPAKPGEVGLVISSRLVMDHIGGMASTDRKKARNQDKWRCRWRHPFHGRPEVEVVLV
ncbi:hypothetical protein BD779DRAFT_1437159 [Infundibulicybe gibba]|nr:hypothetical protein BD779DRAFT_1437159 [Infundibulicybe gibba]